MNLGRMIANDPELSAFVKGEKMGGKYGDFEKYGEVGRMIKNNPAMQELYEEVEKFNRMERGESSLWD
ncbi:MAG: hypothetical protein FWC16_07715 [Defluviitaleaceae bacterium]|nr:hypothetical protein [Defluviitaleaceae bacterium]MCL2274802.1 hypothetical protein [Defluviitaleaceae bacterium]